MVQFTVAIPTFNSAPQLHLILDALMVQTGLQGIDWEVIVVNNNSTDNTAQIVYEYQQKWPATSQLRYILEPTQGAGFARNHAVQVAYSDLVGFLDDDVLPACDWVANAYQFATQNPHIGLFSGQIHGSYEGGALPEGFKRIQGFLAVREHGEQPFQFNPKQLRMPTGAAFVVRRKAWTSNVRDRPIFAGRLGASMVGGEDLEPMMLIHKAGWETWYTPTLHATHQIPSWRLEKDYLANLIYTSALCTCQLKLLTRTHWLSKAAVVPRLWGGNLKRLVRHIVKYRQRIITETVPACELAFLLGNLASPFYFVKILLSRLANPQQLPPTLPRLEPLPSKSAAEPATSNTRRF